MPLPGSTPGFYAAAIVIDGRDVLGREVELSAGTPEIRVVYRPSPGRVRGTAGQGEGAIVVLWPEGPTIPPVVRSTQAGPQGAFEFANVPPGDYTLVAFDRWVGGSSESVVPAAFAAGTRVKLQEGGVESVELSITHWPDSAAP